MHSFRVHIKLFEFAFVNHLHITNICNRHPQILNDDICFLQHLHIFKLRCHLFNMSYFFRAHVFLSLFNKHGRADKFEQN